MTVALTQHLRRAGLVLIVASLAAIGSATLLPQAGAIPGSHFCLLCGSLGGVSAVLNILLFVPLGVGLALSGLSTRRAILGILALSALIEITQFLVIPGRNSTFGDVLTNTLGGTFGFVLGRYAQLWLRPSSPVARNLTVVWAAVWLAIQIISSYGFAVSLPDSKYYGQIAHTLGNFAVFRGHVITADIDGVEIPDTVVAESHKMRQIILDGGTVATTVVPAGATPRMAPIIRIADDKRSEIILLAQDGDRMAFGIRTGAVALRARPPLFALDDVFPTVALNGALASDTMRLSGRYAAGGVTLKARVGSLNRARLLPITASLGWTLWLPFQWSIVGSLTETVLSSVWLFCLAIPLGYWSYRMNPSVQSPAFSRRRMAALIAGVVLLGAGLAIIPVGFGLPIAPLRDWLGTLAGLAIGAGLSANQMSSTRDDD